MASKSTIDQLKAKLKELLQNGSIKMSVYFGLLDLLDSGQDLLFVSDAMKTIEDAETKEAAKTAAKQATPSSGGMTQAEYDAAKKAKYQEYKAGKITNYAYIQWKKKNDPALNPAPAAPAAPAGLTQAEYEVLKKQKYADYKAGKITNYAYIQWKKKNDPSLNGGTTASNTQSASPMTFDEWGAIGTQITQEFANGKITEKQYNELNNKLNEFYWGKNKKSAQEVKQALGLSTSTPPAAAAVPDPGQAATDKAVAEVEKRLRKTYKQAYNEITQKMMEWSKTFADRDSEMQGKVASGEITQAQYDSWLQGQALAGDLWKKKLDQVSGVLLEANQQAMEIVNGQKLGVFAENANYQSYQLTQDTKLDLSFAVYDADAVAKLVKDRPELLPRKQVNGKKDKAWNQTKMSNIAAQAIIQGESIPQIARRIATETASDNMKAMVRYARTAMTSAQNAGRMETLHRAKGMGIQCKKVWLATLDRRTRDSHRNLDGQVRDIDEPFDSDFGKIMFPGDPEGHPGDVYNCRCTLTYQYLDYPADPSTNDRLMYEEWDEEVPVKKKDKNGKEYETKKIIHHRESKLVTDVTYDEWAAVKQADKINSLNFAKVTLAEAQKAVVKKKIKEDKVYSDLWKDDVTLADFQAKKGGIQAKRDYYEAEIAKLQGAISNGQSWATPEKLKEMQKKLKLLNEFEQNGQLLEKRDKALQDLQDLYNQVGYQKPAEIPVVPGALKKPTKKASGGATAAGGTSGQAAATAGTAGQQTANGASFAPDAYSQQRKDKALWTTDRNKVDSMMRAKSGEVWNNATAAERDAIFEYTLSYHKYNEPLRGIEYGSSRFVGVGNADLNAGSKRNGKRLNAMTDILDKCSYDFDMWLQRGCMYDGMNHFFQCDMDLLKNGTEEQLKQALLGKTVTEYAFMSMGSSKGKGFTGDIMLNVYAPKGTKMMFVEPFSYYGHNKNGAMNYGNGLQWDGKSKQPNYGEEFETIMQQGTQFRIAKIERNKGKIWVDIEVINQDNQQRWKP